MRYARFCKETLKDSLLALELHHKALKLQPNTTDILCEYGMLMHERNHHEEAQQVFETVLQLNPEHVETISNYGVLCHAGFADIEVRTQNVFAGVEVCTQYGAFCGGGPCHSTWRIHRLFATAMSRWQ